MNVLAAGVRDILVRFNAVPWVSPDAVRRLLAALPAETLLDRPASDWAAASELPLETVERLRREALAFNVEKELAAAERLGVRLLDCEDAEYPGLLKSIPEAPLVLYVQGALSEAPALAFVGSRRPTLYGRRMARTLAGEAASEGLVVVSGLARGIDTESHRAALDAGGVTWAVLGSGLDVLYPPENGSLAREIVASGGCLISEFPFSTSALPAHFPRRNRIVSGLSWGTVVVEGELRSGSLITARLAVEQSREVFAVPGPADSRLSDAPHRLIAQGAKLITSLAQVWEELPPGARPHGGASGRRPEVSPGGPPPSIEQQKILQCLGHDSRTLEELGAETGIVLPLLANALFELELQGLVEPLPGQRYAKKES